MCKSGWVSLCAQELGNACTNVCTVIGFPLGAICSSIKALETKEDVANGADEVDMVLNISAVKSGVWETVEADITAVVSAATGKSVKVILETFLPDKDEIVKACKVAQKSGADFVKTSTGFSDGGATIEDIQLMRQAVGPDFGVKASGGIRTTQDIHAMIAAGANRIGVSGGINIVNNEKNQDHGC